MSSAPPNFGRIFGAAGHPRPRADHVLAGADSAAAVSQLQVAATVEGENVMINAADGMVTINDATVTMPDIMAQY